MTVREEISEAYRLLYLSYEPDELLRIRALNDDEICWDMWKAGMMMNIEGLPHTPQPLTELSHEEIVREMVASKLYHLDIKTMVEKKLEENPELLEVWKRKQTCSTS